MKSTMINMFKKSYTNWINTLSNCWSDMALLPAEVISGKNVLGSSFLLVPTQSLPLRANKSRAYEYLTRINKCILSIIFDAST